jgi:hypothetical protein
MSLEKVLMDHIAEIIDSKCQYKILRRPMDQEFASAWGVTLDDITNQRIIPCIECGMDIIPRMLLSKNTGKPIVYCSKECRVKHTLSRLIKFNEDTNIKEAAQRLVKACLIIDITSDETDVKKRTTPLVVRKLLSENNRLAELGNDLLKKILEELRDARQTRRS